MSRRLLLLESGTGGGFKVPSGCVGWWDASKPRWQDTGKTTPALLDGDVVGNWPDQSGQGRDASNATAAKKGTLKLASLNSLPGIQFDGVANELDFVTSDLSAFTIFSVHSATKIGNFCGPLNWRDTADGQGGFQVVGETNSSTIWTPHLTQINAAGAESLNKKDATDTYALPAAPHVFEWDSGPDLKVDTVSKSLGVGVTSYPTPGVTGAIGRGFAVFGGIFYEILVFNRVLSGAEYTVVENYLKRWGLY